LKVDLARKPARKLAKSVSKRQKAWLRRLVRSERLLVARLRPLHAREQQRRLEANAKYDFPQISERLVI
jgi:hypothetical protein